MTHQNQFSKRRTITTFLAFVVVLAALYVGFHLWYSSSDGSSSTSGQERYVVILSLDGFRTEYLERASTPALDAMAREGVKGALIPSYPSNTFPNHYSMATGLYPEHHGIVNNSFWVEEMQDFFKLGDEEKVHNPAFYLGEPIWNTAEKQGVKAGCYYWVGSETPVQGMRPSYWKVYDGSDPFMARADSVIAWLQKPEELRPRFIAWYIQEPDASGHHHGTESREVLDMCQSVDSVVGYFRSQLSQLPIASKVDFIVVSDHGMKNYEPDRVVNLWEYLPRDSFRFVVEGAPALLYAKDPQFVDEALEALRNVPHISAYRRSEVPERFHYNEGDRLGDIVIIPDAGGYVYFREEAHFDRVAGHGFDNRLPEMEAIFFAVGESFSRGRVVAAFPNVTIYPLLCRLLGIKPAPNDASEADVDQLLVSK